MERAVNVTVCKCNHLTHFGILFDATGRSSAKVKMHAYDDLVANACST